MENQEFRVGDYVLCLDVASKEFYYRLTRAELDRGGSTWFTLEGIRHKEKMSYPLLYMPKSFVRLTASEKELLIGV